MTTGINLDALERLAREAGDACPGPYHVTNEGGEWDRRIAMEYDPARGWCAVADTYESMAGYFAALDPAAVLALIARVREAEARSRARGEVLRRFVEAEFLADGPEMLARMDAELRERAAEVAADE